MITFPLFVSIYHDIYCSQGKPFPKIYASLINLLLFSPQDNCKNAGQKYMHFGHIFAVILSRTRRTEPLTASQRGIRNITSPRVLNKNCVNCFNLLHVLNSFNKKSMITEQVQTVMTWEDRHLASYVLKMPTKSENQYSYRLRYEWIIVIVINGTTNKPVSSRRLNCEAAVYILTIWIPGW